MGKKKSKKKDNNLSGLIAEMCSSINIHALVVLIILFVVLNTSLFVNNVLAHIPNAVEGGNITIYGLVVQTLIFALAYVLLHLIL